jgi:K+-sensing histidine kinase KdpD
VPVKVQKQAIGLLAMMRKQPTPFTSSDQHLLEALADYAAISLVNARLFRTVEDRARAQQSAAETAQLGEKVNNALLLSLRQELRDSMDISRSALEFLGKDFAARWTPEQRQALAAIQDQVAFTSRLSESLQPSDGLHGLPADLAGITRTAANRLQPFATQNNLSLVLDLPGEALPVQADGALLNQAVSGLLNYVLRVSINGSRIEIKLHRSQEGMADFSIHFNGPHLDSSTLARIFDTASLKNASHSRRPYSAVINLSLVKEIILKSNGKIRAENQPDHITVFHLLLPITH